jgi:peptide/nickel transport system substrate-binding protein
MLRRAIATLSLAGALMGGCGGPPARSHPDELRLAVAQEPHSLVTLLAQSITENELLRLIADPLIACDAAGRPVPALAVAVPSRYNGGISADGLRITYRLRHGAVWHDGKAFTSADVAASFRAVMDPQNAVQTRHGYDVVARVETPDAHTVRFVLKRPFAPFVGTVFAESDAPYYLAPAHLVHGAVARSQLASTPIGTGPYEVVRWTRGDRLELAANAAYWGGKPAIPRITVRFMPDENSQLVGLRSGDLDGVIGLSANSAANASSIEGLRISSAPLNAYFGIMMNNGRGPMTDVRLRRAVAEAADAAAFRTNVTHGYYAPAIADLPPALWATNRRLAPTPHDLAGARRLIAAAGYGPARRLPLDLAIIATSQTYRAEAVQLQSELRPLGIDVSIHPYFGNVYDAPPSEGGILTRGRYDLALYGWYAGMDPDDSGQFLCDQRPPAGYNHSFYCSPAMDVAQRDALRSYEEPTRRAAYARIEALLLRDAPIAFLASPVAISALRADLQGFAPTLVTQTANAQRWTMRTP